MNEEKGLTSIPLKGISVSRLRVRVALGAPDFSFEGEHLSEEKEISGSTSVSHPWTKNYQFIYIINFPHIYL